MLDGVLTAEYWTQAHDNRGKSGLDMLVGVRYELLDVRQNRGHDDLFLTGFVQVCAEIFDLCGGRSADFGFSVLEEILESWNQICFRDLGSDGLL